MLSFISLVRQIESATTKGYDETEIVEAVILAICPGLPLRSYLESTPDLKLPRLRQILRSHFRESNASDLYHQLTSLTQSPKEDALSFVMKALELRQKIIFASKEADVAIKYNAELVQSQFLHTVDMGLLDDGVRHRIQPLLKGQTSDELLIQETNVAVAQEAERKSKLFAQKKVLTEATGSDPHHNNNTFESPTETEKDTEKSSKSKVNLVNALLSVQAEIESLKGSVSAMMSNQQQPRFNKDNSR